jgi:hypothetical protein
MKETEVVTMLAAYSKELAEAPGLGDKGLVQIKWARALVKRSNETATDSLGRLSVTKDLFIETIQEIHKQVEHDRKCADAFKVILPEDHISTYKNHWLQNQLIKCLQLAMNDNHGHSWIEYFMWELDFGMKWKEDSVKIKGKSFKLQSPEDLWNLLTEQY